MKGKIDGVGDLYIERAGVMKAQQCPHADVRCGDWCSLFGEPYPEMDWEDEAKPTGVMLVELCERTKGFTEFTDER